MTLTPGETAVEQWAVRDAALTRMRKAIVAGKGVRLTAAELQEINITVIGQILAEFDEEPTK